VDFLLALIELFSLGVTAEALRAIIGSKSAILLQLGPVDPKFQVEVVAPHQPFFVTVNYSKLPFVRYKKICTDLSSVLLQFTRVTDRQTDGRTDRILIAIPRLHYMQRGKKKSHGLLIGTDLDDLE